MHDAGRRRLATVTCMLLLDLSVGMRLRFNTIYYHETSAYYVQNV